MPGGDPTDGSWVDRDPLAAVLTRLLARVRAAGSLPGNDAAAIARRLIRHEAAVGGPYRDDNGLITRECNGLVAELMRALGSPLPNVEAYLGRHARSMPQIGRGHRAPLSAAQLLAQTVLAGLRQPLRTRAFRAFDAIVVTDASGELSRLAELFGASLIGRAAVNTVELGAANLLTWVAYSLYDDVIDEEGSPFALPVANVAHRHGMRGYANLQVPFALTNVGGIFDAMDEANAWELAHCRFDVADGRIGIGRLPRYGSYEMLARRARAHVIGPLMVAESAGFTGDALRLIGRALDDYLVARQLNDDLHDWVKDFDHGHVSPVVARLLDVTATVPGEYALTGLRDRMRTAFWESELEYVSRRARYRIRRARTTLVRSGSIAEDSPFITAILEPIADSLARGLARHAEDKRFLAAYSGAISPRSTLAR